MPDILIRGISLDDCFGKTIEIGRDADGYVFAYVDNGEAAILDVAELQPHGDLIDRNAAIEESEKPTIFDLTDVPDFLHEQPVVIPADKETQNAN